MPGELKDIWGLINIESKRSQLHNPHPHYALGASPSMLVLHVNSSSDQWNSMISLWVLTNY